MHANIRVFVFANENEALIKIDITSFVYIVFNNVYIYIHNKNNCHKKGHFAKIYAKLNNNHVPLFEQKLYRVAITNICFEFSYFFANI